MINDHAGDWGEPQKVFTFKPAAERFFLMGILFVFLALFGLYSAIESAVFGNGEFDYFLAVVSCLGLMASLFYFRKGLSLRSVAIRLFERGFVVRIGPKDFPFAWDEIAGVFETVVRKWGSGYWHLLITRSDGESFGFLQYEVEAAEELRDVIQQNTAQRGIAWQTKSTS